ncbi:hypothetical protein TNCV_2913011 [Trichonephila clavipes]|nr:hypothetical protein TNCV_2913011 [Trichonephila clavipes]
MQDNISAIPCSCRPRVAPTNLSNSCTCGLERFPSARNDTFVDSELCSYTGDSTPLLKLSDNYSTCEVVQVTSSSHISRTGTCSEYVELRLRPSFYSTVEQRALTSRVLRTLTSLLTFRS